MSKKFRLNVGLYSAAEAFLECWREKFDGKVLVCHQDALEICNEIGLEPADEPSVRLLMECLVQTTQATISFFHGQFALVVDRGPDRASLESVQEPDFDFPPPPPEDLDLVAVGSQDLVDELEANASVAEEEAEVSILSPKVIAFFEAQDADPEHDQAEVKRAIDALEGFGQLLPGERVKLQELSHEIALDNDPGLADDPFFAAQSAAQRVGMNDDLLSVVYPTPTKPAFPIQVG